MNGYFWLFACCALWMTPVSVHVSLRIDSGVHYRLKLYMAGVPLMRRTQARPEEKELDGRRAVKGMASLDGRVIRALWRGGQIRRLIRAWTVEEAEVHAQISQADAAQTALLYAALRTALQALLQVKRIRSSLHGGIRADFEGNGSQVILRCILAARLGNLLAAAVRIAMAIRQIHTRLSAQEEEPYAAASD